MKIQFRDSDCTEWEIQTIMDFISYEKSHGRECELDGEEQIS